MVTYIILVLYFTMELLQSYFDNPSTTPQGHVIPPIKDHLATLGCTHYYAQWSTLIHEILEKITHPYIQEKFLQSLFHTNQSHANYHQEPYGWHALCCGLICSHYAQQYGVSVKTAFKLGFLHDIGKPFTETPSGSTAMHGQIGVHLANMILDDIDPTLKQVLLFLIDQHMCVCTHTPQERNHICFSTLQHMIQSYSEQQRKLYGAYYKCLVYGDRLGAYNPDVYTILEKVTHIQQSTVQNILQSKLQDPITYSGTLFLVLHGAPGCGKSYAAQQFAQKFAAHNMTVGIAERDHAYYIVARKEKLIPSTLSFVDFVETPYDIHDPSNPEKPPTNTTYYKHCYPILKNSIADHYKNIVLDYAEKYDIVLIDSCVSLNLNVLNTFISANDIMLVYTGFPQHLLGRKGSCKVETQSYYPLQQENALYRSSLEIYKEPQTQPTPLVSSSCIQELCDLIVSLHNHQKQQQQTTLHDQVYPSSYLQTHSLQNLQEKNPTMVIDQSLKYYKHPDYNVLRLTYYDGKQSGNGTTLHYRGEHLLSTAQDPSHYMPLRLSLPVSPETSQLRKFQTHAYLYKYIQPLQKYLKGEFSMPPYIPDSASSPQYKCYILPKVDGSLMNVCAVKKDSPQGCYILALQQRHNIRDFCTTIEDNVYYIGSKSCLFATQASNIVKPFQDSIVQSYGSFDSFYQAIHNYANTLPWSQALTLAFEAVPEHPYFGLTIDYGRSFVTHLATLYYDETSQKPHILLPNDQSKRYLSSAPITPLPCSPDAIEAYYAQAMDNALQGNVEDLEGFMLAFVDEANHDLLYMKLKFPWYYAAHKPDIHFMEAEELHSDPKYQHIAHKLFNLQVAMNTYEMKKHPHKALEGLANLVLQCFNIIHDNPQYTRKEFMVKLFAMESLPYEDEIEETFQSILSKFYMKMECKLKSHLPPLYDALRATTPNDKKLEAITTFYIKLLKW